MEDNKIEFNFLGEKVYFKYKGDRNLVIEAVRLAEEKIKGVQLRTRGMTPHHQLLLTALLELSEDYVKAKYKTIEQRSQLSEKTERLMSLLQNVQK